MRFETDDEGVFGAYLKMDWVVNKSIDRLNQKGFYAPPVTFVLLLLKSDKLAKVVTRFSTQLLDQ